MFAVQRIVVLVHEHRQRCGGQRCGHREHGDGIEGSTGNACHLAGRQRSAGGRDRRAAHAVAAIGVQHGQIGDGVKDIGARRAIRWRARVAADEWIRPITRQDRDVIALAQVESNLTGIERRLLRARAAHSVADVTDHGDGLHRLTALAGQRTGTARRHYRHRAGVEVRAIVNRVRDGRRYCRTTGRQRIGRARRIDIERAIFLDDPAVVGDRGRVVGAVQHLDSEAARRREDYRDGHWRALQPE